MAKPPLCIDLYCGLGGWADGFLAEGYDVVGFDIERQDYGSGGYPGQLVLQDVLTLHGEHFRSAAIIVASPPCQFFSRMAMPFKMPWSQEEFERRKKLALSLYWSCFRIAHEAGVPLIVENVAGAQKWVGRSRFVYGSFHLWGDVPALMPSTQSDGVKVPSDCGRRTDPGKEARFTTRDCGAEGLKFGGGWWKDSTNNLIRKASSRSSARKAASAMIAKIPFPLAQHIARVFKNDFIHT